MDNEIDEVEEFEDMEIWSTEQLESVGIDDAKLSKLIKQLERCGRQMKSMGLELYAAAGSAHLIHESRPAHTIAGADRGSIVATVLDFPCDGGDW